MLALREKQNKTGSNTLSYTHFCQAFIFPLRLLFMNKPKQLAGNSQTLAETVYVRCQLPVFQLEVNPKIYCQKTRGQHKDGKVKKK